MPSVVELAYRPTLSPESIQTYVMNLGLLVIALEVHNLGDVRSITICGGRCAFMLCDVCHIVLEQHPQLRINCEVDPLHPQVTALQKLDSVAGYPVEQAKLHRDEISATRRLLARFPECLATQQIVERIAWGKFLQPLSLLDHIEFCDPESKDELNNHQRQSATYARLGMLASGGDNERKGWTTKDDLAHVEHTLSLVRKELTRERLMRLKAETAYSELQGKAGKHKEELDEKLED
jgi:hypothetical protein